MLFKAILSVLILSGSIEANDDIEAYFKQKSEEYKACLADYKASLPEGASMTTMIGDSTCYAITTIGPCKSIYRRPKPWLSSLDSCDASFKAMASEGTLMVREYHKGNRHVATTEPVRDLTEAEKWMADIRCGKDDNLTIIRDVLLTPYYDPNYQGKYRPPTIWRFEHGNGEVSTIEEQKKAHGVTTCKWVMRYPAANRDRKKAFEENAKRYAYNQK